MRQINRFFRLLGTAFCFSLFGLGGLFLSLTAFPLLFILIPSVSVRRRKAKLFVHYLFKFFMGAMRWSGVLRFAIFGAEELRTERGSLILANHPSLIDVVAIISVCPQATCIVKDSLLKNPLIMAILRAAGYISGADGAKTLQQVEDSLKAGDVLIVFPEGTRTSPQQKLQLKRGACQLAVRLNCHIRLVHILMQPSTLTKNEKWYNIPRQKPFLKLTTGEKIRAESFPNPELPVSLRARYLTRIIAEKLEPEPSLGQ